MEAILPHVFEIDMKEASFDLTAVVQDVTTPIEVEIGCGNGRFLAATATKRPNTHFIGVERMMDRVRRAGKKAEQGELSNFTILRVEAGRFIESLLPDGSITAFYLFFPDPWPKRRHHKHRFFQRERCDDIYRTLTPHGFMHISTDHEEYYQEMYSYLSEDPRFTEVPHLVRTEDEYTDFEKLFLGQGLSIYSCSFQRN